MIILGQPIPEENVYDVIVALEMVKCKYLDKKTVKLKNGWKLSVSRYIQNNETGEKDYLQTSLAVRMANYIEGIKITELALYPDIEEWIREGQEIVRYEDMVVKSGNLFLIKKTGNFFISDGLDSHEIKEPERRKIAYAMKYRWYYRLNEFFITDRMATFKKIPIKEPPKFYLLMEL